MTTVVALRGLVIEGTTAAWARLGFEVEGNRFEVGGVTFALTGREPGGIRAWHLAREDGSEVGVERPRVAVTTDVDGLAHESVAPTDDAEHRNGAQALDHLVVRTPDMERTTSALGRLGILPRRSVERVPGRDGQRFRFFLLGTALLELIAPAVPRGDQPARFAGIAFATPCLDELAGDLGARLGPVHDAVQPGRRIASVDQVAAGIGVPVAFITPR